MLDYSWFDGFSVVLERENSDQWKAYFVELPSVYGDSLSPLEAIARLKITWEKYKEECRKNEKDIPLPVLEKDYSGRFNVRLDKELHKALVNEAMQHGLSLNALIYKKLKQSTVISRQDYSWILDEVRFWGHPRNAFLLFSEQGKSKENGITLNLSLTDLKDILGKNSFSSEEELKQCISLDKDINKAFQEFLRNQGLSRITTRQYIISCVLMSEEEAKRIICANNEPNLRKLHFSSSFYLVRINA